MEEHIETNAQNTTQASGPSFEWQSEPTFQHHTQYPHETKTSILVEWDF